MAQNHHLDSLSHLDYSVLHNTELSDIWGYTDEFGNEYALIGAGKGVSIVDVTDPENPVEVYWHVGSSSVWRDIKTFGDYAYITTEALDGLLIIDLSPLPNGSIVSTTNYTGDAKIWQSAHNIYIDENGYGYIFGSNYGNGGAIILDLFTDPMQPAEVGEFDNWYIHDGYVINNTLYAAHVNDGFFTIVDITDKTNPIVLGSHATPSSFTHNIWTTADQNYAFTTDEVTKGYLAAYNIADPNNIFEVDRIQSSPGKGIVPHNAHVLGDFLVTSYYADGVVIHDISDPSNMVEVARYDTYPGTANYTIGNWGVYPFLSSGTIIATDIENGLFVLGSNYNSAARIEGTVTNANNGDPIQGVEVTILGGLQDELTKVNGTYKTGTVSSGSYAIRFEKYGYEPKEITVTLTENSIATADIELIPLPQYNVTIKVLDFNNDPILGADVRIKHQGIMFDDQTNGLGEIVKSLSYSDTFYVAAGKWGRITECADVSFSPSMNEFTFILDEGYRDDFSFDFGWSTTSSADIGDWERGVPFFNTDTGLRSTPDFDSPSDCGEFCFITGNTENNSVMGGEVILISPVFDLSTVNNPYLNFDRWFFNFHGYFPYNDTLRIAISNGVDLVEIDKKGHDTNLYGEWIRVSKRITDYITPSATMQIFIQTSDAYATNNITNAAFDNFAITSGSPLAISEEKNTPLYSVYPNPFDGKITIEGTLNTEEIRLFNLQGREMNIQTTSKTEDKTTVEINNIASGTYLLHVNGQVHVMVKQ
jgi:choice-of-anchor B domain-containing protein